MSQEISHRSVGMVSAKALWQECAWCAGGTAKKLGKRARNESRDGAWGPDSAELLGEHFALTLSEVEATRGL